MVEVLLSNGSSSIASCDPFQEATFEPYKSVHEGMVYVDSDAEGIRRTKEGRTNISFFL